MDVFTPSGATTKLELFEGQNLALLKGLLGLFVGEVMLGFQDLDGYGLLDCWGDVGGAWAARLAGCGRLECEASQWWWGGL